MVYNLIIFLTIIISITTILIIYKCSRILNSVETKCDNCYNCKHFEVANISDLSKKILYRCNKKNFAMLREAQYHDMYVDCEHYIEEDKQINVK